MISLVVLASVFLQIVLLAQELPPQSASDFIREYFTILELPQQNCLDSCNRIEGVCNQQRITQLALNIDQCRDAVISFVEWTNTGSSVGRYALFPGGSGVNNNAKGGCVARTVIDQPQSPPLIQIQTRIAPLPPDPNNTMTGYTGFHCEESNPSGGSNWSRLCPCLVNITTPVSVAPSSEPSVVPSLQANLNTIYIRGSSLAQLQIACGIDNFIDLFRTTLEAVYDLEKNELGDITVFELNLQGSNPDSPGRMLGISFYVILQNSSTLLLTELDTNIKASIENNALLEVLESLGSVNNCYLQKEVMIVGLNKEIELFDKAPVDVFLNCNALLSSNNGGAWNRLFQKESYGAWLILLVIAYSILLLILVVFVIGPHYSCLVYGTASSSKFKHLWTLVFSLILLKILFFGTVVASWKQNSQTSFACTERFFITGTTISTQSLNLLQLTFVPFAVCMTAGLLYVDLGLELSYSSISSGMSCLAFGPFVWLFVILYVIFAFTSSELLPDSSSRGKTNVESTHLGDNDQEISANVLRILFCCILLFVSCIWLLDISSEASVQTIKRRSYSLCVAVSSLLFGIAVIAASVPDVYTAPGSFFFINAITVRILEVFVVTGSMLFLLNEMNTPAGKPAFVSAIRQGRGNVRPISYPRGPRGVSFDPLWLNGSTTFPPLYPNSHPSSSYSSPSMQWKQFSYAAQSPLLMGKQKGTKWTSSIPNPPNVATQQALQWKHAQSQSTQPSNDEIFSLQKATSPNTGCGHYPVCNGPFDISGSEEDGSGRQHQEKSDEFIPQSPPLIPTASVFLPPRPHKIPSHSHLTTTNEYPSSEVSEDSTKDSFPLIPLWRLGSRSAQGQSQGEHRIPTHNSALSTTSHTSHTSSIVTSSAMSPSEIYVIKDYYDEYNEECEDESRTEGGRITSQFEDDFSQICFPSDEKSHIPVLGLQINTESMDEEQETLEEDSAYEWSLSQSCITTPASNNDINFSPRDERLRNVWTSVPGVHKVTTRSRSPEAYGEINYETDSKENSIASEVNDRSQETRECLETDTDTSAYCNELHSDLENQKSGESNSNSQSNHSLPSVSVSGSSRSSRSSCAPGEVKTGNADTVAYFNL